MRRLLFTSLIFIAGLEIYSVLPLRVSHEAMDLPFVVGALHVPLRGDPATRTKALAAEAKRFGLDFIVLANLDKKLPDQVAGEYEGVDVFTEIEASTPAGHAVYFSSHTTDSSLSEKELKAQAWRHYNGLNPAAGAFLVVAHPSSASVPWDRLDRSAEGIELFNLRALIEQNATTDPVGFLATLLIAPFNAYLSSLRWSAPNSRDLKGWDAVNSLSPGHFATVATDDLFDWPFVREAAGDRTSPLHVATNVLFPSAPLSSDFGERRKQIYAALKQGSSALLFQTIHPFQGNGWELSCAGGRRSRSGATVSMASACEFLIHTPSTLPFTRVIKLIRDGETVQNIVSKQTQERFSLDKPGSYRVEVWVKHLTLLGLLQNAEVPYVFYNPLYVR